MTFLLQTHLAWKTQEVVLALLTLKQCLLPSSEGRRLVSSITGLCHGLRGEPAGLWMKPAQALDGFADFWQRQGRKLISPYSLRKHKQFSKLSGFHFPNTSLRPTSSKGEVGWGLFHMQTRRRRPRWRGSVGGQGICWPSALALCVWERKWWICGALWEVSPHALTETLDKLNASLTTTKRVSTFKRNQHPSDEVQRSELFSSCSSFHLKLFPL